MRKRLTLFVEGDGDKTAVPVLVKRLLTEMNAWDAVLLDPNVFKVGHISKLTGRHSGNWPRFLKAAARMKGQPLGGVLLLLDGDADYVIDDETKQRERFCAATVAQRLALKARDAGAGTSFSVACVFACMEYESWLLAGVESLRGRSLSDGRAGVNADAPQPAEDTEKFPRDAKKWFQQNMSAGYAPTTDQRLLTELVDINEIRRKRPRSFLRLEKALSELCAAIRTGQHVATPCTAPSRKTPA
ncbi:MAG: DUF4276 family protein [Phycisphaerae bacterium]|jgi:hypothetical protein